ncbi:response regulator [Tahibacter amnicola]|uniref:Response regulator n=1 Tax=Tahibacter amnicola TaxID=2976241 RepID=A0ABY6BHL3_9GAMM|nr:response regulator [Tahibacter amnicola]UXI69076.1 response regulator [Tahibacter amnicola]
MSKPCLLLVDDEARILRSLALLFRTQYEVLTTTDGVEALRWVRERIVHVVVSDQRMPGISGVDLLRQIRDHSPRTMRILLTGFADLEAVEASVNEGEIFRFLEKPWNAALLMQSVAQAAAIACAEFAETGARTVATVASARVLVLDEDPATAALMASILPSETPVTACTNVESALAHLGEADYGVIVAEIRHGSDDVIGALKLLKQASPGTLAIACSSLRDGRILIDLINQGQVFRFLPKPLGRELTRRAVMAGLERHALLRREPIRVRRHAVEAPREISLPGRVMDYFRRIRDQARQRA